MCNMTNYTTPGQACAGYTSIVPLDARNALTFFSAETVGYPGPTSAGARLFSMRVTLV